MAVLRRFPVAEGYGGPFEVSPRYEGVRAPRMTKYFTPRHTFMMLICHYIVSPILFRSWCAIKATTRRDRRTKLFCFNAVLPFMITSGYRFAKFDRNRRAEGLIVSGRPRGFTARSRGKFAAVCLARPHCDPRADASCGKRAGLACSP